MKRLLFTLLLSTIAVLLVLPASAQPRRYRDRDDRYHEYGRIVLDHVRGDLARVERHLRYISPPDMRRFENIRDGLASFESKWQRGHFDRGDLSEAISNLHALVDRGRLRPGDRDLLSDDLRRLRVLRDRTDRGLRG